MKQYKGQIIILASGSLWRKRLLKKHGIPCRVHVSSFQEVTKHVSPRRLVLENAKGKALDVAQHYKTGIVIGVDTVGVLEKKILGKPKNRSGAKAMLMSLCGRAHFVMTGLCVIDVGAGKKIETVVNTKLKFRKFSVSELERYLNSGQWKGKAGSYAIQGRAKGFVEKIDGDVTNVVGLPIPMLKRILAKLKIGE